MSWSVDEYTLAEVKEQLSFPCVVRVTEGYHGEGESESFSRDDIIKIDEHVNIQKMVASFVTDLRDEGSDYTDEIQIPVNYRGKVRVVKPFTVYNSVEELSRNPPRYVKVLDGVRIPYGYKGEGHVIKVGTVLEIDRVLPPMPAVNNTPPKERTLVVNQDDNILQLPFSTKKRFRVEPDRNTYTLREVIDRFNLPQTVQFVDTTVQEVFALNLKDGIENMSSITGTLRLKRLILQDVLIGHYKGNEYSDDASSTFVRRSVVVIPISEFAETVVQVLEEDDPRDYELFVANNFSQSQGMSLVDGALYAEFTRKPVMFKFPSDAPGTESVPEPPPRPPKPGNYQHTWNPPKPIGRLQAVPETKGLGKEQNTDDDDDDGDYEKVSAGEYVHIQKETQVPPTRKGTKGPSPSGPNMTGFSLADCSGIAVPQTKVKGRVSSKIDGLRKKVERSISKLQPKSPTRVGLAPIPEPSPSNSNPVPTTKSRDSGSDSDNDDEHAYDEPEDVEAVTQSFRAFNFPKRDAVLKPTATVSPVSTSTITHTHTKLLKELTVSELNERLDLCGLQELAKVCLANTVDGHFLVDLEETDLVKEPFNMKRFHLRKLEQMKLKNWIPQKI